MTTTEYSNSTLGSLKPYVYDLARIYVEGVTGTPVEEETPDWVEKIQDLYSCSGELSVNLIDHLADLVYEFDEALKYSHTMYGNSLYDEFALTLARSYLCRFEIRYHENWMDAYNSVYDKIAKILEDAYGFDKYDDNDYDEVWTNDIDSDALKDANERLFEYDSNYRLKPNELYTEYDLDKLVECFEGPDPDGSVYDVKSSLKRIIAHVFGDEYDDKYVEYYSFTEKNDYLYELTKVGKLDL